MPLIFRFFIVIGTTKTELASKPKIWFEKKVRRFLGLMCWYFGDLSKVSLHIGHLRIDMHAVWMRICHLRIDDGAMTTRTWIGDLWIYGGPSSRVHTRNVRLWLRCWIGLMTAIQRIWWIIKIHIWASIPLPRDNIWIIRWLWIGNKAGMHVSYLWIYNWSATWVWWIHTRWLRIEWTRTRIWRIWWHRIRTPNPLPTFLRLDDEQLTGKLWHSLDVHQSPVNLQSDHFLGKNSLFAAVETAGTVSMGRWVVQTNLAFAHLWRENLVVQPTVIENYD